MIDHGIVPQDITLPMDGHTYFAARAPVHQHQEYTLFDIAGKNSFFSMVIKQQCERNQRHGWFLLFCEKNLKPVNVAIQTQMVTPCFDKVTEFEKQKEK